MKKIFRGFAALPLLAMLATSCEKERIESSGDSGKVIVFKTAVGKQTLSKASEVNLAGLQTASATDPIEVVSYETGSISTTPYMPFSLEYGTYNSGWGYAATPEFHPEFGLTHYSTYPEVTLKAGSNGTSASFDYTIPGVAGQVDLLAASTTTTNASAAAATANLVYNHVLSQVNFAVAGLEDVKITISNIRVSNVKNTNTYTFDPVNPALSGWGTPGGTDSYDYTPTSVTTDGSPDILYMGNTGDIANVADRNNDNANALMLMPQSFAAGDAAGFTFDYVLKNGADAVLSSGTDFQVKFGDTALAVNRWDAGKRYLYTINFETPYYITFTVGVNDWEDYQSGGGIVDVDIN